MKRHFCVLMVLLSVLMLTSSAFSATWTNSRSNDTFSFTGTTVSTSTQQSGHGMTYYRVSGSADISGSADALGDDDEYEATMWLEVTGDTGSNPVPGRDKIDETQKRDEFTQGAAKILFRKQIVASVSPGSIIPGQHVTSSFTDSTSVSYVDGSYTSCSGLSASPACSGSLSGEVLKSMGSVPVESLGFGSKDNTATGCFADDGEDKCHKPFLETV